MSKQPAQPVPKGWPEPPFLVVDSASIASQKLLILARSALAWVGVEYSPYDVVRDLIVHDRHISRGPTKGKRFYLWEHNTDQESGKRRFFKDHTDALRKLALRDGATPEAIRLLNGVQPFSSKEVEAMADKLAKKTEKPKAEKAAKAPAAADKPKRAGNPEALAKARAARAEAGPDLRKITIVKKENPYREGSNRATSFAALKGAKTVDEYKTAGGKAKYISRWVEEGLITVK